MWRITIWQLTKFAAKHTTDFQIILPILFAITFKLTGIFEVILYVSSVFIRFTRSVIQYNTVLRKPFLLPSRIYPDLSIRIYYIGPSVVASNADNLQLNIALMVILYRQVYLHQNTKALYLTAKARLMTLEMPVHSATPGTRVDVFL